MHHTLKLYSRYQKSFLRMYIFLARWTRIPLLGRLVRKIANIYGDSVAGGYLLTTGEAEKIVESAGALALGPCSCRRVFQNCDNPEHTELLVGPGKTVFMKERPADFKEITPQKAVEILRESHSRGLIHTIVRCREDFYAICNCCTCCCVPLRLNKEYGIGNAVRRRNGIVAEVTAGRLA